MGALVVDAAPVLLTADATVLFVIPCLRAMVDMDGPVFLSLCVCGRGCCDVWYNRIFDVAHNTMLCCWYLSGMARG